jgi:hypothetical protein
MSIETAGTGIKTLLTPITTLRQIFAPNELTKSPNVFPCALIIPSVVSYGRTLSGRPMATYRVLVLFAPIDTALGIDAMLPLMEADGPLSVFAVIAADQTLSGGAAAGHVVSCSGIGATEWNGTSYQSTEFMIEALI